MNELLANLAIRPNDIAIRHAIADYFRDHDDFEMSSMWFDNKILPHTMPIANGTKFYAGTYADAIELTKYDKKWSVVKQSYSYFPCITSSWNGDKYFVVKGLPKVIMLPEHDNHLYETVKFYTLCSFKKENYGTKLYQYNEYNYFGQVFEYFKQTKGRWVVTIGAQNFSFDNKKDLMKFIHSRAKGIR